jgi:SET domain-containing protein
MLTIKASVKPSKVHGLGLFADEKIPKGTVIWKFNPRFDIYFEQNEVEHMPKQQREFIMRYAPLSVVSKKYVFSIDDSRFMNHSSINQNMDVVDVEGEPEKVAIANRDIKEGEELLTDYRQFDVVDQHDETEYLKT